MLYTAVLIACLATSQPASYQPATHQGECRTHEMLINAGANPISAYIEAQTQAAEWLSKHPELAQHSLTIHPGRSA